jgi:cyclopropane-fatty-acyl-phospholipid synthase
MASRQTVAEFLAFADIRIDGDRPWDIRVHDERFFDKVLSQGSLGLGEAYMDGWWDCDDLEDAIYRLLDADVRKKLRLSPNLLWNGFKAVVLNEQTKMRSKKVAREHYDLGNDLYERMLDPYMQYSCGYFKDTEDLNTAQLQKLDLICRKLMLKKGERLLDIGCGWGGLAKYAAEHYGVEVTGITISKEQAALARERCKGLPVQILEQDYRDLKGTFDKVVSVGMFEHVGYKNYRTFMEKVHSFLPQSGMLLLHTIGGSVSVRTADPWFEKYIFPNSMLPSVSQIARAYEGLFIMEDWHNFGVYYAKTLRAWHANFEKAWPELREKYGDRFKRMWDYYLLSLPAGFHIRHIHLWQVVLTKGGLRDGYLSPR